MHINVFQTLADLYASSGIAAYVADPGTLIMVGVACVLLYLAIVKQFEPLLLLPIAFGMLLTNLLGSDVFHEELFAGGHVNWSLFGGATLVNSADLVGLGTLTVNAAGAVMTEAGQVIGHVTSTLTEAVRLTETGALVSVDNGTVLFETINVSWTVSATWQKAWSMMRWAPWWPTAAR